MAIEYTMTASCDGCGELLKEDSVPIGKLATLSTIWKAEWAKTGDVKIIQTRCRPPKLYCKKCQRKHEK